MNVLLGLIVFSGFVCAVAGIAWVLMEQQDKDYKQPAHDTKITKLVMMHSGLWFLGLILLVATSWFFAFMAGVVGTYYAYYFKKYEGDTKYRKESERNGFIWKVWFFVIVTTFIGYYVPNEFKKEQTENNAINVEQITEEVAEITTPKQLPRFVIVEEEFENSGAGVAYLVIDRKTGCEYFYAGGRYTPVMNGYGYQEGCKRNQVEKYSHPDRG